MLRVGIAKAKNSLSELVNRVANGGLRVLLESRGRPKAALISLEDLQRLEALEREAPPLALAFEPLLPRRARRKALELADAVRARIRERRGQELPESAQDLEHLRRTRLKDLGE